MSFVFHITSRSDWQEAQQHGVYRADSLSTEGFIHFSTLNQVVRSANKFFAGRSNLVLLKIDPSRLKAELRYDPIGTGERFPHLYGPLNLDAVIQVLDLEPDNQGQFTLPEGIRDDE